MEQLKQLIQGEKTHHKMYYPTTEEIQNLVTQFQNQTLPVLKWTHKAHLTVAIWFLKHYNLYEAICYLRSGIITYNIVSGGKNTPERGYHETLTLFWIQVIQDFIEQHQEENLLDLTNAFLLDNMSNKSLPFEYYSKAHLFTTKGRAMWVLPDLKPFDYKI